MKGGELEGLGSRRREEVEGTTHRAELLLEYSTPDAARDCLADAGDEPL
jgi:hypothetical protein